jgi:hypothetical protein
VWTLSERHLLVVVQAARYRARLAAGLEPDIEDGSAPAGGAPPAAAASAIAAPDADAATDSADASVDAELAARAARAELAGPAVEPAGLHEVGGAAGHWRPPEDDHMPAGSASPHAVGSAAAAVLPAAAGRQDGHDGSGLQPQPQATEQQATEHSARSASVGAAAVADTECPELPVGKAELAAAAAAAASNGVTLGQLVAHLRREGGCC